MRAGLGLSRAVAQDANRYTGNLRDTFTAVVVLVVEGSTAVRVPSIVPLLLANAWRFESS